MHLLRFALVSFVLTFAPALRAQVVDLAYGAPISLADARRVIAAAQAEATKNKWNVAISIVDSGGHLVAFERMDTTQFASAEVAHEKARTSVGFRRTSKAFQDTVASGGEGLRILRLTGAMPIEGGAVLVMGGKIVGAIGVSGVTSAQDGQIAQAGATALK